MKNIPMTRTATVVAMLAATGCAGMETNPELVPFRHIAFHQEIPISGSSQAIEWTDRWELPPPTVKGNLVCQRGFRHPLLNRWDTWLSPKHPEPKDVQELEGADVQKRFALAMRARTQIGAGRASTAPDCVTFLRRVLAQENITLAPVESLPGENGVTLLYRQMKAVAGLHRRKVPAIGDLVFFDNTYDRNGNGRADDTLTHVGIVESIDEDGTIHLIHKVRRGVLRVRMNLFHPDVRRDPKTKKVWNHFLRVGSRSRGKSLTGELFHAFGTVVP